MEAYANALLVAIPSFIILIIIESIYDWYKGTEKFKAFDTISSLSSGVTNLIKDSLGLVVVIVSYPFLVENLALMSLEDSWQVYVLGFIALDFAGYWNHRLSHSINYFWNRHRVHHSSEEFNLPCALRQSISTFFGVFTIFLIPAAFLGVPHEVIVVIAPIHLFLQFWYHTQHIPKLGFLEYIIITPSQHRVHHAINPEYIDKNLGQIFSVWDRMFGTYQEELDDVPPVYGVTMPAKTWNPILINFQHLWVLLKDAWRAQNWMDKLRVFYKPTGWRPADVAAKYPIENKIDDVYSYEKYDTERTKPLIAWAWFQYTFTLFLTLYMFYNIKDIGTTGVFLYSAIIFISIYGYSSLMDRSKNAIWIELGRAVLGLAVIINTGDWFGISAAFSFGTALVALYFISAPIAAWIFSPKKNEVLSRKMI